jgi:two-component system cell cycle sensor histidine kinase/response regulator CckA
MSPQAPFPEFLAFAPDAVLFHDTAGNLVDANEEACRTLGYAREELVRLNVRDLVVGMDEPKLAQAMERIKSGVATFFASQRRKDGTTYPVETRVALVHRAGGPPLVVAFIRDLSEQEAAKDALRASEERHRQLLELLPDGIITYDVRGRITYANPAAARLTGAARPEDLIGTPVQERVHPDAREAARDRFERLMRGGVIVSAETRLLRLDGTSFPADVTSVAIDARQFITVARDVSEKHRAEAERKELEERLRQAEKIEALGTLAGGVAHDFNNVLAAILGHAETLAGELPPGSAGRDDAEQIAVAARRASGVVQQILAFARRRPPEAAPVDVARAVREELPLVRAATPANVKIVLRADRAGAVRADPTQLHQVLLNLCANARDAMAERGGVLEIWVDAVAVPSPDAPPAVAPGRYVRLTVSDTGHGMDAATQARVFEPYFTTKPVGAGSGLGLSVVHGIAAGLGGAVRLDSAVGAGTRVEVWLPRLEEPARTPAPRAVEPAAAARRVLLVDDDPPVARALARMLSALGYVVTTEASGEAALARFKEDPAAFDLVLTDQTLPRMGGDELTRALLAVRPGLPVLICTGYSARLDEVGASAVGARALLPKPIDLRELGAAVAAALSSPR